MVRIVRADLDSEMQMIQYSTMLVHCILASLLQVSLVAGINQPLYLWPLGNTSLNYDVISANDIIFKDTSKCYTFTDGPSELPYSVLDLENGEISFIDAKLNSNELLKDITISFYVKAVNDDVSGTLLHYQQDEREIMRIRTLANTFLVSFRDEYGISAGMMYLVNFLTPGEWSHVIVTRDFETGRITVFRDGEMLYDEDDEFSDIISFSHTGQVRIGKSLVIDDEDVFKGNFACLQLYDSVVRNEEVSDLMNMCLPKQWNRKPPVYYERRGDLSCISAAPLPEVEIGGIINLTVITNEIFFKSFLKHYQLQDSGRLESYFKLDSRDLRPITTDDLLCHVNATDAKVCSRLCMRVEGCQSFLLETNTVDIEDWSPCSLYGTHITDLTESGGSKYFLLTR